MAGHAQFFAGEAQPFFSGGFHIHTAHIRGNIGVTTSSKMLEEYLQVQRFNVCDQIADLFAEELCLMIY